MEFMDLGKWHGGIEELHKARVAGIKNSRYDQADKNLTALTVLYRDIFRVGKLPSLTCLRILERGMIFKVETE
jgi:hypothetical protein